MTNIEIVKNFLSEKPGHLKTSYSDLAFRLNVSREDVAKAVKELKHPTVSKTFMSDFEEFLQWKQQKQNKVETKKGRVLPSPYKNGNPDNVIVIGDLHAPFIREGYLEFCRAEQEKWDCGTVVFIGDIIDGHSWSFHQHDVDGASVKDEVKRSKEMLQDWYQVFPEAIVLYGNHDLLVSRKAKSAGLSQHFVRELGDILGAPKTWLFTHEFKKDGVKYVHGSVGNAITRAKDERVSIVQGHLHTEAFIEWAVSEKDAIFGMNVGCGIDDTAYAFEYAKPFAKKSVISCGIVLENGKLPIVKLMNL